MQLVSCRWLSRRAVAALVVASGGVAALPGAAGARQIGQLVVFGDSLSDAGNVLAFSAAVGPPVTPRPAAPWYSGGRFTNGPESDASPLLRLTPGAEGGNWVDRVASRLGVASPTPSLLGGRNYAYGGATTDSSTLFAGYYLNIGAQVAAYRADPLPSGPGGASGAAFLFWGGGNDLLNAASAAGATPATVAAAADVAVGNLRASISGLLADAAPGASVRVAWANLPLLSLTPDARSLSPELRAALGQASERFAALQQQAAAELRADPRLNLTVLDMLGAATDLLAGRADWSPANTTDNIISSGGLFNLTVTPTRNPLVPDGVNPDTFVWWDEVHPTARMHRYFGDRAAGAIPSPGAGGAALLTVAFASRRRRR